MQCPQLKLPFPTAPPSPPLPCTLVGIFSQSLEGKHLSGTSSLIPVPTHTFPQMKLISSPWSFKSIVHAFLYFTFYHLHHAVFSGYLCTVLLPMLTPLPVDYGKSHSYIELLHS